MRTLSPEELRLETKAREYAKNVRETTTLALRGFSELATWTEELEAAYLEGYKLGRTDATRRDSLREEIRL